MLIEMQPLLTLIDFQSAFLTVPGLEPSVGQVVDRAASLLRGCRELRIPVAHIRTATPSGLEVPRLKAGSGSKPQLGSAGYQPPEELVESTGEHVIHKTGYSGLRDTDFDNLLQQSEVDTLIVTGVYLHACVRQTVLDARTAGFQVWVAQDAVASDDPVHAAMTRHHLEGRGVRFAPVARLLKWLDDGASPSGPPEQLAIVDEAVSRATQFARKWRVSERGTRIDLVRTLVDRLNMSKARLARLITDELGKPICFAGSEVQRTGEMLSVIIGHFETQRDTTESRDTTLRRRPLGTIAVITPFNNAVYLALGKIIPAIIHGNTVVWKPAPEALAVSRFVMDLLNESKWPQGLVSILEGDASVGQTLMDDPRIDSITVTGSSSAGFSAQVAAARRRVPLQAELGGNNAAIIWHDATIATAAEQIAAGAFEMAGQRCTANRRAIVHQDILGPFLDRLTEATRALFTGSPTHPDTRVGPLVNSDRQQCVARMVSRAKPYASACFVPHDELPTDDRNDNDRWYPPTILCCDDPTLEIVQEETFGPVLVVQMASDWRQAMALCNGVRQGLAAAIFTNSEDTARRFLDEACAGILKVNQSTADAAIDIPFGGWKASGVGPPEHGLFDIEFFTRPQTVYGHNFETLGQ